MSTFIEMPRALLRVARSYADTVKTTAEALNENNRTVYAINVGRTGGIVQTWADVTGQSWDEAAAELGVAGRSNGRQI